MGEGLHLNHKVNWSDLKELLIEHSDPGIELPVGPCGLIHVNKKKVQLQVDHRKYLADQICRSSDCRDSGTMMFRKTYKHKEANIPYWIFPCGSKVRNIKPIRHFLNCFTEAVYEFAETERRKVTRVINTNPNRSAFYDEVIDRLIINHPELKSTSDLKNKCDYDYYHILCALFPVLIEAGDTKTLLEFNDDEIRSVFYCLHGGQAVGNNWAFLYYHVMHVYFYTNLIAAFNINPTGWGRMKENSYFRGMLKDDCDGQTFLDSSRDYLKPDVYMKDFASMKELCKNCFKFFYFTEMLAKEVGICWLRERSIWKYFLEDEEQNEVK